MTRDYSLSHRHLIDALLQSSQLAAGVLAVDLFRINAATLWLDIVLRPEQADIQGHELEDLHDYLNAEIDKELGSGKDLMSCFAFLNGKDGENAMNDKGLTPAHRDLLRTFYVMILDPKKLEH